jgi:hypothetical protein
MSAAMKFKNRYTKGNRAHGFKKEKKEMELNKGIPGPKMRNRRSGRNETDPGTRKRGFSFF